MNGHRVLNQNSFLYILFVIHVNKSTNGHKMNLYSEFIYF